VINEEITQKDFNLAVRVSSFAYNELKKIMEKLISQLEQGLNGAVKDIKEPELKHGKQTVKQLQKHNEGLSTVELTDPNLRELYHAMKKDGVDFAAVKDGKGKYTLFFKSKDADTMTHAFKRYMDKLVKRDKGKPSINKSLTAAKKLAESLNAGRNKEKSKSRGAR